MGILSRVAQIVRANLGDLLERTRDPVEALERFVEEMEEDISETKADIAEATREEKRLRQRCEEEAAAVEYWHRQALRALERGEEDLAREALRRKRRAQRALEILEGQRIHQERVIAALRSHLEELNLKVEEARLHKEHVAVHYRIRQRRERLRRRSSRWPELEELFEEAPPRPLRRSPEAARERGVELPPRREQEIEDEYDRRFRDLELAELRERREETPRRPPSPEEVFVEEELRRLKREQERKKKEDDEE